MCGRFYAQEDDVEEMLRAAFGNAAPRNAPEGGPLTVAHGEIFPGNTVLAAANSKSLTPAVYAMRWGFGRSGGGLIINARSETAEAKPLFAQSAKNRRCLIPVTCYFEWEKRGDKKLRYAISPAGGRRAYLCGLYRLCADTGVPEFAVLTREAAPGISFIHPRMPLMAGAEDAALWLSDAHALGELAGRCITDVEYRPDGN